MSSLNLDKLGRCANTKLEIGSRAVHTLRRVVEVNVQQKLRVVVRVGRSSVRRPLLVGLPTRQCSQSH